MALSTQPYKGSRDFYPEDKRIQKYMFATMRRAVERFGYQEYDAPILEPTELYASKTSDEIVNEQTYSFVDRGERNVTIRTEMTPSVSRMVAARRQELPYPLRWYSIPNLWRYERPQRGRLREFWQLNVDLFGVQDYVGDHEVILVADSIFRAFGAKQTMYTIKLNSRRLVNALLLEHLQMEQSQTEAVIRLVDRMHKMPLDVFAVNVEALCTPSQREAGVHDQLLAVLRAKSIADLPAALRLHPSVAELESLQELLAQSGVTNAVFDITLMRGFDYYTDIVFEVFDTHPDNNRAMFGGGRYDGLVGMFGVEPVPTVGFGMGDVTLQNFLETHGLLPTLNPETELGVILIGDTYAAAQRPLAQLRSLGVKVSVDTTGRKLDKQLKSAVKQQLPYVMFIGEQELSEDRFVLKNLRTGVEERHSIERIVSIVRRATDPTHIEDDL